MSRRGRIWTALIFPLLLVGFSGSAAARRAPTVHERAAIAAAMGVPARCSTVWISTVSTRWASLWRREQARNCSRYAGDGLVVLHRTEGSWRRAFQGSGYGCPVRGVPRRVQSDLTVCYTEREIAELAGWQVDESGYSWVNARGCTVFVILNTTAEIALYQGAGDTVVTNPAGTVGAKVDTSPGCRSSLERDLRKVP